MDEKEIKSLEIIDCLKAIDLENSNVDDILSLVSNLYFPITQSEVRPHTIICRCRPGKGYTKWQEMTYKPIEYCKTAQRATLPNETAFYGIISDDIHMLENARAIGISECSKLANQGIDSSGIEYITVSQWEVKAPIQVACIMGLHLFDGVSNKLLTALKYDFRKAFKDNHYAELMSDFVSSEMSKLVPSGCDYQYYISASICHRLLYECGYEGVVYPSVKLGGQAGMNIAIRPDVVSKKIKIGHIATQCYYKNKEHGFVDIEYIWDAYHKRCIKNKSDLTNEDIKSIIHYTEGELNELGIVN